MRKTKIICTLGPASSEYEVLLAMAKAGMNVARINMSHGSKEEHSRKIDLVKRIRKELDISLPIMIDTKGPEVRIKTFKNGKVQLKAGQTFIFTSEDLVGDEHKVSVNYETLHKDLKKGEVILLNDGLMKFIVRDIKGTEVITECLNDGVLSDRKSMFFPDVVLNLPFLSEQDAEDLQYASEVGAEFVAASFVSNAFDVREIRNFLRRKRASRIDIIAKIENSSGVQNIDDIMKESDGIMIARGDMGVELPFEQLPAIQKKLIKRCSMMGKRVITATEMLESMIEKPRPTRAEISDVANAVYDGTSCIMLSGETAMGCDPVNVVKTMSKIAECTEANINYAKRFKEMNFEFRNIQDAVSHSAVNTAIDLNAAAIVVFTNSGISARMISRFRPPMPIIGVTTSEDGYHKLAMSWGVQPMRIGTFSNTDDMLESARDCAKKSGLVREGDTIVIAAGVPVGQGANTNLIKAEIV